MGDPYRRRARAEPGRPPLNPGFFFDARNKKSLALDLRTDAGRAVLHRLVEEADVFITNYPPPVRGRLGITYDDLTHAQRAADLRLVHRLWRDRPGGEQARLRRDRVVGAHRADGPRARRRGGRPRRARCRAWATIPRRWAPTARSSPRSTSARRPARAITSARRCWRTGCGPMPARCRRRCAATRCAPQPPREEALSALRVHYQCRDGRWLLLSIAADEWRWDKFKTCFDAPVLDDARFATDRRARQACARAGGDLRPAVRRARPRALAQDARRRRADLRRRRPGRGRPPRRAGARRRVPAPLCRRPRFVDDRQPVLPRRAGKGAAAHRARGRPEQRRGAARNTATATPRSPNCAPPGCVCVTAHRSKTRRLGLRRRCSTISASGGRISRSADPRRHGRAGRGASRAARRHRSVRRRCGSTPSRSERVADRVLMIAGEYGPTRGGDRPRLEPAARRPSGMLLDNYEAQGWSDTVADCTGDWSRRRIGSFLGRFRRRRAERHRRRQPCRHHLSHRGQRPGADPVAVLPRADAMGRRRCRRWPSISP